MKENIEINLDIFKGLLPPKFGIAKRTYYTKRDINGHKIKKSYYYVIYKRTLLFFRRYLDFYEYDMRPGYKDEISFVYYGEASCGYRFKTLEEAKEVLNMIITSPERFVKRY